MRTPECAQSPPVEGAARIRVAAQQQLLHMGAQLAPEPVAEGHGEASLVARDRPRGNELPEEMPERNLADAIVHARGGADLTGRLHDLEVEKRDPHLEPVMHG